MADKDKDERAQRRMDEACSEDEVVMASIIDEFFDNAERNHDDNNSLRSHIDLSVELDAANIARDGEERDDDDADAEGAVENDEEEDELVNNKTQQNKIIIAMTQ